MAQKARAYERKAASFSDVQSYVITSAPKYDANTSSWTPGSGYLGPAERLLVSTATIVSGGTSPQVTPGFGNGNYTLPLKSLTYSHKRTEQGQEGYREVYFVQGSRDANSGPGSAGWRPSRTYTVNSFGYSFGPRRDSEWSDGTRRRATQNLLSAIKNSTFNAGIATAERKRTMDMVASAATRIAGAGLALKRGQFAKAAQKLGVIPKKRAGRRFNRDYPIDQAKAVGNAWLELQYGWKPLMNDVYGSVEALAKAKVGTNAIFIKRIGRSTRIESTGSRVNYLGSSERGVDNLTLSTEQNFTTRMGVTFSVSSPRVNDLKQIGLTNPLLIAWELVPFSFVADWFLPVGNYLNSLDATLGLSFQDGYVSTRFQYNGTAIRYTASSDSIGYRNVFALDESYRRHDEFVRTTLAGFPAAPTPSFKNPISTSHVASAMALLLQTFKR